MDKIKVFNNYFDSFAGSGFQTTESDDEFYTIALGRMTDSLNQKEPFSQEEIQEQIDQIIFWAFYTYGDYTFRTEEPIMDVEIDQLPINMNPDKLTQFKEAIEIVVGHFEGICKELGKLSPITMKDFEPILNRTEKFTMDIPAIWLNT